MDLFEFVGKYVEVELYRKKFNTKDHIKCYSGRLTDVGGTMICLQENNGKYRWIPKPNMYKDKIMEVKDGKEKY